MGIKKKHLLYVIVFLAVALLVIFITSGEVFAGGPSQGVEGGGGIGTEVADNKYGMNDENILLRLLGSAFILIANLLYSLLGEASMDSLVFNTGGALSGLSLFKPGATQDFLADFYKLFNYIAIALFIPIVYWSAMAFTRAGDNPQGKSILKDKLMRVVLTFAFLYTMPELVTLLVRLSNAFVDVFRSVGGGITNPVGDYIATVVESEGSMFVNGITALMLIGINLWMIFFYIIRDLTIAFLFLFFPIVAIWFPLTSSMVLSWWKNMASNILSQPIQAVILSLVLTMTSSINTANATFLDGLYMIVAFGAIIPMTGIIKGFLGLEGGVGAASSRAGVGGLIAAMTMMRMAGRNAGKNKELIKEGLSERSKIDELEGLKDKNRESESELSSTSDYDRPLVNPTGGKVSSNKEIMDMKREANKKVARGLTAFGTGAFTGMVGASIGGGLGARTAMVGGLAGYGMGATAGGFAGEHTADVVSGAKINASDSQAIENLQMQTAREMLGNESISDEELSLELQNNEQLRLNSLHTAQEKHLGIYNENLSGTSYQNQRREAMMKQRFINNAGTSLPFAHAARKAYAKGVPRNMSDDEIMQLQDVNLYQDKDMSYLYRMNEGQVEILKTGAGVPGMIQPMDNPVSFDGDNVGMAADYSLQYQEMATAEASQYMAEMHPNVSAGSDAYKSLHRERYNESMRQHRLSYQDTIKTSRNNFGIPNMNVMTNQVRLIQQQQMIERQRAEAEYRNMFNEIEQMEEARRSTTYADDPLYDHMGTYNVNVDDIF